MQHKVHLFDGPLSFAIVKVGVLQNEKTAARPVCYIYGENDEGKGQNLRKLGMAKQACPQNARLLWKIFSFYQLCGQFFGRTGLKTSVFPFHPKLF